jgi:hypothetical protein
MSALGEVSRERQHKEAPYDPDCVILMESGFLFKKSEVNPSAEKSINKPCHQLLQTADIQNPKTLIDAFVNTAIDSHISFQCQNADKIMVKPSEGANIIGKEDAFRRRDER